MNLVLVSLLATLAAPGQDWMTDYGQALEAARAARKPLLIVLDNSTPAEENAKPVAHRGVTPLLASYVLCRIDVSTPYGEKVAAAFHAQSFPQTAVIDNRGSVILARRQGTMTEADWTALLTTYETGRRRTISPPAMMSMPQPCFT
jgi:hypothetical protein